jgi:4-amino-4-deoxy-L-arabinose transferase-like glycosyltransferase
MFGEKSFGRAVHAKGHSRPFLYFLWHFPVELMPWTIFAPTALVSFSDRRLRKRLLGWIAFVIGFFSLLVCKRNLYILAAYPAAAMLLGAAWADMSRLSRRWRVVTASVALGLIWLLAVGVTAAMFVPQVPVHALAIVPTALVLMGGASVLTVLTRRDALSRRWFYSFCTVLFLMQATVGAFVFPAINELKGPVEAAAIAKENVPPGQPVYMYGQQLAIFPLYADRPGREIHSIDELHELITQDSDVAIVFGDREWRDVKQSSDLSVASIHEFPMGHKNLALVLFSRQ